MKKENRRAVLFFCLIYPKMLRSQPKGVQRLLVRARVLFGCQRTRFFDSLKKENRHAVLFFCLCYLPKILRIQPKGVQRLLVLPSLVGRTERI